MVMLVMLEMMVIATVVKIGYGLGLSVQNKHMLIKGRRPLAFWLLCLV